MVERLRITWAFPCCGCGRLAMPLDRQGASAFLLFNLCNGPCAIHQSKENMKNLLLIAFWIAVSSFNGIAQERIDSEPARLSYKSKEIKNALYWQKSSKTGRWESRKNTTLVYLGEGIAIDNFNNLFIGEYRGARYLFLDFREYSWRYPAIQTEWIVSRMIMAALLSENQYSQLSSLSPEETVTIIPRFYHKMFKGRPDYSFPFFLSLGETERSAAETLYQSYCNDDNYGKDYAEQKWKEDYPSIYYIVLKRTVSSNGQDVVRFALYPHALPELIDNNYFEVDYSVYRNLFLEDKKKDYK